MFGGLDLDSAQRTRVALGTACVLAPGITPLAGVLPGIWGALPLVAGVVICALAYRYRVRSGFLLYGISSWCASAVTLSVQQKLDSSLSASFADSAYLMAFFGLLLIVVPWARIWSFAVGRILSIDRWTLFAAGVFISGIALRIACAYSMNYLYDEIADIDRTGIWFSQHLFQYIFQFQQTAYPPDSPSFSNPPLALLFFGAAIKILGSHGVSALLAARFVSVLFSAAAMLFAYKIAGRWFSGIPRLAVLCAVAWTPTLVVLGGTAYQEVVAAAFAGLVVERYMALYDRASPKNVCWLALALALALLGKLTNAITMVLLLASLLVNRKRIPLWMAFALPFLALAIICILWSGARDARQISDAVNFVVVRRNDLGVQPYPSYFKFFYYELMAFGTYPALISIGLLAYVIDAAIRVWRRTAYEAEAAWLVIVAVFFLALPFLVGFSGRHEIVTPLYAMSMWFGFATKRVAELVRNRVAVWAIAVLAVANALSIFVVPAAQWDAFNNVLVGRLASLKFYITGDGDLMSQAADWLNEKSPRGTHLTAMNAPYILRKYMTGGRTVGLAFPRDTEESLWAVGSRYVVIPEDVFHFPATNLTNMARDAKDVHDVMLDGKPYIRIYELPFKFPDARSILGTPRPFASGASIRIENRIRASGIIDVGGAAGYSMRVPFHLLGTGIAVDFLRSPDSTIYLDLVDVKTGRYMRGFFGADDGTRLIAYMPYDRFQNWAPKKAHPLSIDDLRGKTLDIRITTDGGLRPYYFEPKSLDMVGSPPHY